VQDFSLQIGPRVVVVGAYGAGKSTLASELGAVTGLPVHHLDAARWGPDWVLRPREEWLRELDEVLAGDAWIVDGNFEATLGRRLAVCDTAIFLDFPMLLSARRVVRRRLSRKQRQDLPDGLVERLNLRLLGLLRDYPRTVRPELVRLLRAHAEVLVLRGPEDVAELLRRVQRPTANDSRFQT
jgi:adenylate kinase family enzyme